MKQAIFALVLIMGSFSFASATERNGDESQIIPLEKVWAFDMPGTRDVRELDPDSFGHVPANASDEESAIVKTKYQNAITTRIKLVFMKPVNPDAPEALAFAVQGTGKDALQQVFDHLIAGEERQKELATDESVSIVFFARLSPVYVHLDRIERNENEIEITYRVVPHGSQQFTSHFALIPLEDLDPGPLTVNVLPAVPDEKFRLWGVKPPTQDELSATVSQSFTCEVGFPACKGADDGSQGVHDIDDDCRGAE